MHSSLWSVLGLKFLVDIMLSPVCYHQNTLAHLTRYIPLDILKQSLVSIVAMLITVAVTYGSLQQTVITQGDAIISINATLSDRNKYILSGIQLESEMDYVVDRVDKSERIWEKLDTTLNNLDRTLIRQESRMDSLEKEVSELKDAVVR